MPKTTHCRTTGKMKNHRLTYEVHSSDIATNAKLKRHSPTSSKHAARITIVHRHGSHRARQVAPAADRRPRRVAKAKHRNICRSAVRQGDRAGRKQQVLIGLHRESKLSVCTPKAEDKQLTPPYATDVTSPTMPPPNADHSWLDVSSSHMPAQPAPPAETKVPATMIVFDFDADAVKDRTTTSAPELPSKGCRMDMSSCCFAKS